MVQFKQAAPDAFKVDVLKEILVSPKVWRFRVKILENTEMFGLPTLIRETHLTGRPVCLQANGNH
jgi:hypothetical protein